MGGIVDFVFLIDGTGSMQPCIDALKENLGGFLDELTGAQSPVKDWRGRVVAYRDHKVDGNGWLEALPFVQNDVGALKAQVNGLEAAGGGDEAESLLDALHWLCQIGQTAEGSQGPDPGKWRYPSDAARVVVVFTDATYHDPMTYPEGATGTWEDVKNAIVTNKVILFLYAPDHVCYDSLSSINDADYVPIPGPDFVAGLANYTSDKTNFNKVLVALAKTISKSAPTPQA